MLTALLAQGPTPTRVSAALPGLVLVTAAAAAGGLLQTAVGPVQASLIPRIEQRAQHELYSGLIQVPLLAFDDPDFTSLVEKASRHGLVAVRQTAQMVATLTSALVSILAAVCTVGILHPALIGHLPGRPPLAATPRQNRMPTIHPCV